MNKLSRQQIAWRLAQDIPEGAYINLGSGMPLLVSDYVPSGREVIFHSENGILGMGPRQTADEPDPDLVNAGNIPVTLLPGGAYFHQADSFMMIRGGHIDISVLGAYQVSAGGDLANWHIPGGSAVPAVGGAMDLAAGAKHVVVMMELFDKQGRPKLLPECSLPLTGQSCVSAIYTDMAVFDLAAGQVILREIIEGITLGVLQAELEIEFSVSDNLTLLSAPVPG